MKKQTKRAENCAIGEYIKIILDDLARKQAFIEGLAGVNHLEDESEDESEDCDWTQTVQGHAALESMQGDGTVSTAFAFHSSCLDNVKFPSGGAVNPAELLPWLTDRRQLEGTCVMRLGSYIVKF